MFAIETPTTTIAYIALQVVFRVAHHMEMEQGTSDSANHEQPVSVLCQHFCTFILKVAQWDSTTSVGLYHIHNDI